MEPQSIKRRGVMLVLSSPSGTGKSTISRNLLSGNRNLELSVSVTTRARRGSENDQAGDVGIDLLGREVRRKQVADEEPSEQRHRERLDGPVDEQRYADTAPVFAHLV